jgi:hypothetical protein
MFGDTYLGQPLASASVQELESWKRDLSETIQERVASGRFDGHFELVEARFRLTVAIATAEASKQ